MKTIILLITYPLLLIPILCRAQDIHFSQFYMAPLFQNPALAGATHNMQAIMNYKNQWQSVGIPFKTYAFSYDMRLGNSSAKKGFWAAGVTLFSDKAGDAQLATTEGGLTVAYHIVINKYSMLGAGFQGCFAQRTLSYSSLLWGSQDDGTELNPALPSGESLVPHSISYPDLGAGVNWVYDNTAGAANVAGNHDLKADAGFAIFHVNQPKYSFYGDNERLHVKYVLHGTGLVCLPNSNIGFQPGFLYYGQGSANELCIGSLVRYKLRQNSKSAGFYKSAALSIGAYYRTRDAAIAALLLEYSHYALGISYDINTSPLTQASHGRGGVEISIRYVAPNPFGTSRKEQTFL